MKISIWRKETCTGCTCCAHTNQLPQDDKKYPKQKYFYSHFSAFTVFGHFILFCFSIELNTLWEFQCLPIDFVTVQHKTWKQWPNKYLTHTRTHTRTRQQTKRWAIDCRFDNKIENENRPKWADDDSGQVNTTQRTAYRAHESGRILKSKCYVQFHAHKCPRNVDARCGRCSFFVAVSKRCRSPKSQHHFAGVEFRGEYLVESQSKKKVCRAVFCVLFACVRSVEWSNDQTAFCWCRPSVFIVLIFFRCLMELFASL